MNFEDLKKNGVNYVEIADSLKAPLLQLNVIPTSDETISTAKNITVYLSDTQNERNIIFPLLSPLHFLNGVSDEFFIEPKFRGSNVTMDAYVVRKIKETYQEKIIEVGANLSGKTLILNFPDILGTYSNYFPGLFSSDKYRIRESFEYGTNRILLQNITTNEVVATLYEQIGENSASINLSSFTLPDDFGIVTSVIEDDYYDDAFQYIKVNDIVLSIADKETIEQLVYQPIILSSGYNKISTNYNCNLNCVYPKNIDLVKYFLINSFTANFASDNKIFTLDDIYFKDCFTKIDEKLINAIFNKLTIKCMNSTNNKFSLDCDGNLVVNSLTTKIKEEIKMDFNKIYPVGSLYLSVSSTNPNTFFGGTWVSFGQGKTLVGVNPSETEFNSVLKTGGSKTVTLSVNQIPAHNHSQTNELRHGPKSSWWIGGTGGTSIEVGNYTTENTGGGQSHNNLQPYITVYIWRRTA